MAGEWAATGGSVISGETSEDAAKRELKEELSINGDPVDRGLIAQAKQENMILLSHDRIMENYDEPCIRMV